MAFLFQFVYLVDYIDRYFYVQPCLHLCNEAYLIVVGELFDDFWDSTCMYLIECIYTNIHERNWSLIFEDFIEKNY